MRRDGSGAFASYVRRMSSLFCGHTASARCHVSAEAKKEVENKTTKWKQKKRIIVCIDSERRCQTGVMNGGS